MKIALLSPIRLQAMLVGLSAVFVIASLFAQSRAFLIVLTAAALGAVLVLRLINPRRHPPAIGLALSLLLGAIFANIAWKEHWGWAAIVAFAVFPVVVGAARFLKTGGTRATGDPGLSDGS